MKALALVLLLASPSFAAMRHVRDQLEKRDVTAININFDSIDKELANVVHKTSTETIKGYKSFNGVSVATLTVTSATVTSLSATAVDAVTFKDSGFSILPIFQTVLDSTNTATTTTSTSWTSTNLSATITPKATTSKILVIAIGNLHITSNGGNGYASLFRSGTNLGDTNQGFGALTTPAAATLSAPTTLVYLDSPSTTSATTYNVRIRTNNGLITVGWNSTAGVATATSYMYLIEIGQ